MFRIGEMRLRAGLTQQQAADALGVKKGRYGSWEREDRDINLVDAVRLADLFRCTLDELAGYEPPSSALSASELQLISDYRSTDDRGRRNIAAIAAAQRGDAGLPSIIDEVAQ